MLYEEINDNIDHILRTVGPTHVAQYDWLIQNIHQVQGNWGQEIGVRSCNHTFYLIGCSHGETFTN